jgi:hypothetical protein
MSREVCRAKATGLILNETPTLEIGPRSHCVAIIVGARIENLNPHGDARRSESREHGDSRYGSILRCSQRFACFAECLFVQPEFARVAIGQSTAALTRKTMVGETPSTPGTRLMEKTE